MVGRDGAIGIASALDGKIAASLAITQLSGDAMVCDPAAFRGAVLQSESLLATVMRHEQTLFAQAQQSTACMAHHESPACPAGCCAPAIYREAIDAIAYPGHELDELIRMLQACTPLHQLSAMEARAVFELLLHRG
jgi:hypothetical protein